MGAQSSLAMGCAGLGAIERLAEHVPVLEREERPLEAALGYVLAEDICLPAGVSLGGKAAADAPVPRQSIDRFARDSGTPLAVALHPAEGSLRGHPVLPRGVELHPGHLWLLASLGWRKVSVVRRPSVAIMSTGSELTEPGRRQAQSRVYGSNAYCLAAQVYLAGGLPVLLGTVPDDEHALRDKLYQRLDADFIVTSGGTSRGDYDFVRKTLAEGESAILASRIKLGKSVLFGVFVAGERRIPYLGLPGNPAGCLINFELYGREVVFRLRGRHDSGRRLVWAILSEAVSNPRTVERHVLVKVAQRAGLWYAQPVSASSHGAVTSLLSADGLAIIPAGVPHVKGGDRIEVVILPWQCLDLS